jgi:ribose transport system ATP-binding protein
MATGLDALGISKTFGATKALDNVSFSALPGEIHALLGENGAGKSTLVKIIMGSIKADQGSIEMDGVTFEPSPRFSAQMGLVVVHQELSLLANLTVAENISLGQIPIRQGVLARLVGRVDRKAMSKRAKAALELMALDIDPQTLVSGLGQAERQLVEIARAQAQSPRIILLDEPTSSLPPDQRGALFRRMERVRQSGVGIVFITHSLEEALKLSDRITVLRDGKKVSTVDAADATVPQLIEFMSGRPPGSIFPRWRGDSSTVSAKLSVEGISSGAKVRNVSLTAQKGEVVGLAGLVGSGRTETLKAVFGASKIDSGTIRIDGKPTRFLAPADAISARIAFIPENRQEESLFLNHSVSDNICVAAVSSSLGEGFRRGRHILHRNRMLKLAENFKTVLQIKTASVHSAVSSLSGGNQQKTVLARWMATRPAIILADEPTRGISIVNKIEIYKLVRQLASQGAAIVIASSEFEELVGLCDRVFIIRDGVTEGEIEVAGLSAEDLLEAVLAKSSRRPDASQG